MSGSDSFKNSVHPITELPSEDLELVTQLVLRSGSLKELAEEYGVSYPTIRARLDRVIERLRALIEGRPLDPVNELLARMVEQGEISVASARALRDVVRRSKSTSPNGVGGERSGATRG